MDPGLAGSGTLSKNVLRSKLTEPEGADMLAAKMVVVWDANVPDRKPGVLKSNAA
jgi:hypothetical protein